MVDKLLYKGLKMKILIKQGAILLAGSLLCVGSLWAKENDTKPETLILHHFLSSKAPPHTKLLEPWARKLEKISNGKIKVEIYPSMSMGGKPNELYKQSRDGVADIVYTVAGYTPGVFPRLEVLELPTIHTNSSLKTAQAAKENFDLIKADFKKVKPLIIAMTGAYQLHTSEKKVTKYSDIKGMKLRSPSRTGAWYFSELGADPVGMPLPAVAQSLAKNAVEGAALPMEVFPAFKFDQLTKYSIELNDGGGFGGSVLLLLMNKDKYDSLSKELQEAIDKSTVTSIEDWAKLADNMEVYGKSLQKKSGGDVVTLNAKESAKFKAAGERVVEKWVKEMNDKGIDGQKIVDAVKKSMAK